MVIELAVLNSNRRLLNVLRDSFDRNKGAILLTIDFIKKLMMAIIDFGSLLDFSGN